MAIDPADGRPWVLVPGTLCTGAVFGPFLDALGVPPGARHTVDLRHPEIGDYLGPLTALGDPRAIICGFSLGAIVAAHLADRIEAAECLFFGLTPRADDPAKRDGRLALAADVARLGGAAALGPRLGALAGPDPEAARARILAMADETAGCIEAQTRLALERPGALPALARAAIPVTILTGTDDVQAPLALAREAAEAAARGRVVPLTGLGHYALVEDPASCARAVAEAWRPE
ncbi:alpha/beta hydrolase [Roseibacterium sp. SDUM158016]|uniref:alpha/beta fold hydrolase n=1 Tax=Roseicyclus sediminis TaxID=2980997 RepID=UPI0021D01571|nr:alpha/beta hydrolase [Roseibacterium sp. SDUM158016]MCU4651812.1 alpha/beta hydrolase [Roseibacterium sp. SDUM158016]